MQFNVGTKLGQFRAAPVDLGDEDGMFLAYCQDAEVDPYVEMFFFPRHPLTISVYTRAGQELWTRELGPGVIPGIWFVPFFPFDLDGDGVDEIWFVNNIDNDGCDEVLWGERCISLDTGRELFCADADSYRGHSDVVAPILDRRLNRWYFHTCRESGGFKPRVATFDDRGRRVWADLETGHMDMGWAARLGARGEHVSLAIRIGAKSAGPQGFFCQSVEEFTYESLTGKKVELGFSVFCTLPVDLNGDGVHELVRGIAEGNGEVLDRTGRAVGNVGGSVAMASKFMDRPAEQILCYSPDGTVTVWADENARDSETATWRYAHPFYRANQRLTATGYNVVNLGGL